MSTSGKTEFFRLLPSVDDLLRRADMQAMALREGHAATVEAARAVLAELRGTIANGGMTEEQTAAAVASAPEEIARRLQAAMAY